RFWRKPEDFFIATPLPGKKEGTTLAPRDQAFPLCYEASEARACLHIASLLKLFHLPLGLFSADPVPFLKFPQKLVATASDHIKFVVCKPAPALFDLSLKLAPVSFYLIPIHDNAPFFTNALYKCVLARETTFASISLQQ